VSGTKPLLARPTSNEHLLKTNQNLLAQRLASGTASDRKFVADRLSA
jgi:hypothetical protein